MEKFINGNPLLGNSEVVRAFDAQAVEEERDRLKNEVAEWEQDSKRVIAIIHDATASMLTRAEKAEAALAASREEVGKLREALKEIRGYGCSSIGIFTGTCCYGCDTPSIADEALKEAK